MRKGKSITQAKLAFEESYLGQLWKLVGPRMLEATPIAPYTEPRFAFTTAFGDHIQVFTMVFRVDRWQGTVLTSTDETTHARFFAHDELLMDLHAVYRETLADLELYEQTRQFILK